MIRIPASAAAAIAAGSFTVAFAVSVLSSPPDEAPRTAVRMMPAGAASSPVVAERARLRSVGSLPVLRIPAPAPTPAPAAPTPAATPEPTPVAPATDTPVPPRATPAPVAPAPEPSPPPAEPGPIFDSSG